MRAFAAVIALVQAVAAEAQSNRITSAYTRLDLDRCKRVDTGEEQQSATWRCSGYAGVPLIVQAGDDRFDVDAGREDKDEFWGQAFDYPGRIVEWRLRGGKPFAVIYRLNASGDGAPKTSRLIVETIGRASPGCRVEAIDAGRRHANAEARRIADSIAAASARCLNRR